MLNRVRDLIVQAANTASSDTAARQAAQDEIDQLRSEIDRIASTTAFGASELLNGSFGNQAARVTEAITGADSGVTVAGGSSSFDLTIDAGGTSLSVTVSVAAGTYTTAASYETAIQDAIDTDLDAAAGFTGAVTVNVRDLGSGVWSVELVRNSTDDDTGVAVSNVNGPSGLTTGSAQVTNSGGGVFQVGANVTSTEQILVSISDIRITNGTVGAFTSLSGIDVTNVTTHDEAQTLIDDAINAVSTVRGSLGGAQNRFESTISTLQIMTENLAASESRIRDTDMAAEMVTFTRHQILLQAGTAMLAQANAAPQSVLRLLQ
jgi:flagellin